MDFRSVGDLCIYRVDRLRRFTGEVGAEEIDIGILLALCRRKEALPGVGSRAERYRRTLEENAPRELLWILATKRSWIVSERKRSRVREPLNSGHLNISCSARQSRFD